MAHTPIVDIDPYYADKKTFMVINKEGTINRLTNCQIWFSNEKSQVLGNKGTLASIPVSPDPTDRSHCLHPPHVRLRHHHHNPRQLQSHDHARVRVS